MRSLPVILGEGARGATFRSTLAFYMLASFSLSAVCLLGWNIMLFVMLIFLLIAFSGSKFLEQQPKWSQVAIIVVVMAVTLAAAFLTVRKDVDARFRHKIKNAVTSVHPPDTNSNSMAPFDSTNGRDQ